MLKSNILDTKLYDNNDRNNDNNNSELERGLIINWITSPEKEKNVYWKRRFELPRVFSKSIPRRNKTLFRYRINRSLNFDTISSQNKIHYSSNPSPDSSSFANKSLRNLSRSAKIMNALNINRNLFHHRNASIKKSLTFDLSPSPKRSSFNENTHTDSNMNTPSPVFNKFVSLDTSSTDSSTTSMLIASSLDSIDENQNQTPQQNRKVLKTSNTNTPKTSTKENTDGSTFHSTNLLRTNLRKSIDDIVHIAQTPDSSPLKWKIDSNKQSDSFRCEIVASTPRNLFHEFNKIECDRPSTPENMINLIPESMSAIKKSHKKERSFRHRQQLFMQQMEDSIRKCIRNENFHTEIPLESSEINNISANSDCGMTSTNEHQKKNEILEKPLIHNSDISPDTPSTSTNDVFKWKDMDFSNEIFEESTEDNFNDKEDNSYICNKNDLQEESSNISNVNMIEEENRNALLELSPVVSQNSNEAVTPENISQHSIIKSIKKSHQKIKRKNKKALHKLKIHHHELEITKSTISNQDVQNSNDDQCENSKNKPTDTFCILNAQNSDRPCTPENVNSSRLLLSQFCSVKKSHKKDKTRNSNSSRIFGSIKYQDKYQKYKKDINKECIQGEKNINKTLHKNREFSLSKELSCDVSLNNKKMSTNVSFTSPLKSSNSSPVQSPENMEHDFKIYTPIRSKMSSILATISNCVCSDKTSPGKNESTEALKEIDIFRCVTPVAHCSYRSNIQPESSESFKHGTCVVEKSESNSYVSDESNISNFTCENGRLTPINMPTKELLCNINSIKKSHKKDKHDPRLNKRQSLWKKQSYIEGSKNKSFPSSTNVLEGCRTPSLKSNLDMDYCVEMKECSNMHNKNDKSSEIIIHDNFHPSMNQKDGNLKNKKKNKKSKLLNITPPNYPNAKKLIKLLRTTSIKKSHKKERKLNAQAKYILMNENYDLSDDGSIFDEEDRLTSAEMPFENSNNKNT